MFTTLLNLFAVVNDKLLALGRAIGTIAIALMVVAILVQVFFRYVLNNALPWPDEAARFFMLWMTGLMAPSALRSGGFVAIDTLQSLLPKALSRVLSLILLLISLSVIAMALRIGWNEIFGFGGLFKTASLYVPTSLSFDTWHRVPRSWMMASLVVGFALMLLVNIELILRTLCGLDPHVIEPDDDHPAREFPLNPAPDNKRTAGDTVC